MKAIKKYKLLFLSVLTALCLSACEEESLLSDPSLSETPYDPIEGASGVDERINSFYEKYATCILYEFEDATLNSYWSNFSPNWYAPVKEGNETYVDRMLDFLEKDVLGSLPDALVSKYLPYRIFFVDSLCNNINYDEWSLTDMLELSNHSIVLSHVGPDMELMDDYTRLDIKERIINSTMNSIYNLAKKKPTEFNNLRSQLGMVYLTPDPLGEFSDEDYALYSNGLAGADDVLLAWMNCWLVPQAAEDLAYFITFMITKPKAETDRILPRFDLLRQRCVLVA